MEAEVTGDIIAAVLAEDVESLNRCLSAGCSQVDIDEALCEAALKANPTIVKLLLQNTNPKPNVRFTNVRNERAIHCACVGGNVEVVKFLYQAGSAIHAADELGQHPLHIAAKLGHVDVVQYLLFRSAHINSSKTFEVQATPLHLAIEARQLDCVKALVDSGRANLNCRTSRQEGGNTPLHMAVLCKFLDGVQLLCDRGADVNARNTAAGKSPLYFAANIEEPKFTRCLLAAGADVDAKTTQGWTPLMNASCSNRPENALALIEHGADINHSDNDSRLSPVIGAITARADRSLRVLLASGADPNASTSRQEHPLLVAASHGNPECVRLLLDAGADIDVMTSRDATVLHRCQRIKYGEARDGVVRMLIEGGAKLNVYNKEGYTPLHNCVFQTTLDNFSLSTLKLLVMAGARVDLGKQSNKKIGRSGLFRNSPLCWLVWNNYIEAAEYLVGCDWYLYDESWMYLPGKTREHELFNDRIRHLSNQPFSLSSCCRLL
ncbi:ankyrin repeat, PH and SEC7 domain containing protein secG-like isoform X2 [Mizuhopecten yessoensis]|uniref:Ankyrin-3 n=1 Tax=Mizuhopecten yessoensis TaxID=6573 RepID=A0A210QE72_MIZYE|nr:ankyrin repeat, PH and SEC7 domain containing protein secG-like isoform X2 [Mizuhopecten yessoensis]OWF47023.1 Ankyrin-3 [Mizuhopecten yessoensis]